MIIEQLRVKAEEMINYKGKFKSDEKLLFMCFFQKNKNQYQKQLDQLIKLFPYSHFSGASGAGEICGDEITDDEMVINIIKFSNGNDFKQFEISLATPCDSVKTGAEIAQLLNEFNATGAVLFSDGLNVDGALIVDSINRNLKNPVQIIGGLAGDGVDFKETYVLNDQKIQSHKLTIIAFKNSIKLATIAHGGWERFGLKYTITKSVANVVYEIDHKPALDFYKEYLGKEADKLPASGLHFPLMVFPKSDNDEAVVRTLLAVDHVQKSLTFAGSILQGSVIDIMKSTSKSLIHSTDLNSEYLNFALGDNKIFNKPDQLLFSLIISCVGRRLTLGIKTEEELLGFKDMKSKNIFQSGFYSYGEISSNEKKTCSFHNQTLTQALIWENEGKEE